MANLIVALFEILSFGAIVVLVVLGLGVIASMMGIFNFAQGEFVLLGAYVTYVVRSAGAPVWLGMIAAPFVVGALGFVLERLIVRRFYAAPIVAMLGGIGSFAGPVAGAGLIGTLSAALPWVISPVIADVAVFVLAIIFIKFRPQGLMSGKGV